MKRTIFYANIFLLMIALGTAVVKMYYAWNVQFETTGAGSFSSCEEGFGGFSTLKSYDGESLSFSKARFPSSEAAKECFEKNARNYARIIERTHALDVTGKKIVGERIVALYNQPPEAIVKQSAEINILDENKIYTIASTSLRHAIIYDEKHRNY